MVVINPEVNDMLGTDPAPVIGRRQARSGYCSLVIMLDYGAGAIFAALHQKFVCFRKIKAR